MHFSGFGQCTQQSVRLSLSSSTHFMPGQNYCVAAIKTQRKWLSCECQRRRGRIEKKRKKPALILKSCLSVCQLTFVCLWKVQRIHAGELFWIDRGRLEIAPPAPCCYIGQQTVWFKCSVLVRIRFSHCVDANNCLIPRSSALINQHQSSAILLLYLSGVSPCQLLSFKRFLWCKAVVRRSKTDACHHQVLHFLGLRSPAALNTGPFFTQDLFLLLVKVSDWYHNTST